MMTSDDIVKIAHFIGLHDAESEGERVIYTTYFKGLPNINEFDPIHDPADAWRVLECATATWSWAWLGDAMTYRTAAQDNPEALCAAVLEISK